MSERHLKWLAAIWTVMAAMFGGAWALYSRDFTRVAEEIRDIKVEAANQAKRTDDRIIRLYEVMAERLDARERAQAAARKE